MYWPRFVLKCDSCWDLGFVFYLYLFAVCVFVLIAWIRYFRCLFIAFRWLVVVGVLVGFWGFRCLCWLCGCWFVFASVGVVLI